MRPVWEKCSVIYVSGATHVSIADMFSRSLTSLTVNPLPPSASSTAKSRRAQNCGEQDSSESRKHQASVHLTLQYFT